MSIHVTVDARWDADASVWTATSADVPGLVIEAETWPAMMNEVALILPELIALNGQAADEVSLTS